MSIRTRFAPSPTGYLHVGGLRTALYSYLIAKQQGGQFLLRIEDTDRERFVADGTENILRSLYWAGVVPDEGVCLANDAVSQMGDVGPYIQSERLAIYARYAEELLSKKFAYRCFCTSEHLEELHQRQTERKLPTGYDGLCRTLDPAEAEARAKAGERHVVRMKMEKSGETTWTDLIRGEVSFKNELIDDQIIIKSDGYPTYHFAVVVDDHTMNITHVVRGEEWVSSTPKHIQLYKFFGWTMPEFAHLPLLLNPDKTKLSKRQGDVAVGDYEKKGYLPEALINFVAFLGWNPGTEREFFTLAELAQEFSVSKINKSGAVFNIDKLNWYNQHYIRALSKEELLERALPFLRAHEGLKNIFPSHTPERLSAIMRLEQERVVTLAELPEAVAFAFVLPDYEANWLVWKKSSITEAQTILPELEKILTATAEGDWEEKKLEAKIIAFAQEKGYANGAVLSPLRVALSGQQNSPGPFAILFALGKTESLRRITIAITKLSSL